MRAAALDIELLRTFEAIRETRSFTAAARQVGRTQSAVSLQMRRIEDHVGRPLFVRNRVPIELTPHGETFSVYARRILATYDEAMGVFDRKSVEGVVVLGLPDDYAPRILPIVLQEFVAIYPNARVDVIIGESRALVRRLAAGTLDLAFVTEGEGPTSSTEPIFAERMVWAGPREGDIAGLDPLPIACWSDEDTYVRWMTRQLEKMGRAYRVAVTSTSLTGLRAAVSAGLAVTALMQASLDASMRELGPDDGFLPLPTLNVMLERGHLKSSPVIDRLEQHLRHSFAAVESGPDQ